MLNCECGEVWIDGAVIVLDAGCGCVSGPQSCVTVLNMP